MEYTTVKTPVWANQEKTLIDCVVYFTKLGEVPFTASPNDLPHSVEIFNRCVAGEFGQIGEFVFDPFEGAVIGALPENTLPVSTFGEIL